MSTNYNRRQMLALGLGASVAALGLVSCDTTTSTIPTAGPTTLQMIFWGSTTRDKLTRQAIELFHQSYPHITVTSQLITDFNVYWTRLDTLINGGNTPNLIQMDMRYVAQYVRKRTLLDLTPFVYNQT